VFDDLGRYALSQGGINYGRNRAVKLNLRYICRVSPDINDPVRCEFDWKRCVVGIVVVGNVGVKSVDRVRSTLRLTGRVIIVAVIKIVVLTAGGIVIISSAENIVRGSVIIVCVIIVTIIIECIAVIAGVVVATAWG